MTPSVGVMCADEGHYDIVFDLKIKFHNVGVMCADEGHYDITESIVTSPCM